MKSYVEDIYNASVPDYVLTIITKVKEGLSFIEQYEALSKNEGQLKVIYGNQVGFELYAPHLIPLSLSCTWLADTFLEAFENCINDLEHWISIEKEAPRDKFFIDF